ncbi:hypothetical protein ACHAWF_000924 [Thalassiosira exigua]
MSAGSAASMASSRMLLRAVAPSSRYGFASAADASHFRSAHAFRGSNYNHHQRHMASSSANNGGNNATPSSSSAVLQNLAIFAVAGTIGYGAVALFNKSSGDGDTGGDGPVSPSAPVTSRVYLDIAMQNQPLGRIVIGLYGSTTPKTAHNFESLCKGTSSLNGRQLG